MSHRVPIVEVRELEAHDNPGLEVALVLGWRATVAKGLFAKGSRAVLIEPDYCVPTSRPEFAFLASEGREKCRLRAPLLIPVPEELTEESLGTNVMAYLRITRYAPLIQTGARPLPLKLCPKRYAPIFGTETLQNDPEAIPLGAPVIVTEKIHGAGARFLFHEGRFFMGSRERWLDPADERHVWASAYKAHPEISGWCEAHPGVILFGEVYGNVQGLKYGRRDSVAFAGFAALGLKTWFDQIDLFASLRDCGVPWVPLLYSGPWSENLMALAEEDSIVIGAPAGHTREGIVIAPHGERSARLSNGAFKHISNRYWGAALDETARSSDLLGVAQSGSTSEADLHDVCDSLWGSSTTHGGGASPRRSATARAS